MPCLKSGSRCSTRSWLISARRTRTEADAQENLNDELALANVERDQNVARSNANTVTLGVPANTRSSALLGIL
jgi:hypothetical protein